MEAFNTYGLVKKVVERIPPKQLAVSKRYSLQSFSFGWLPVSNNITPNV